MDLPNKKYKVILADPPWSYDNKNTGGGHGFRGVSEIPNNGFKGYL